MDAQEADLSPPGSVLTLALLRMSLGTPLDCSTITLAQVGSGFDLSIAVTE